MADLRVGKHRSILAACKDWNTPEEDAAWANL
jgi:hypothetical protein